MREPRLFEQPGFFIGDPRSKDLQRSESHPGMIGAGCPVFPPKARADWLFHRLLPARLSLSSLR